MHRPSLLSATRSILLPALLLLCGACDSPAPVAVQPPAPPAAPPPPPPIRPRFEKQLEAQPGGTVTADLTIDRNGNEGPIVLAFDQLPPGLTAEADDVPAGQSVGKVKVIVAETLGDEEAVLQVPITVGINGVTATTELSLKVLKFTPPAFRPAEACFVQPGSSRSVKIQCDRNGFDDVLLIKAPQLPDGITCTIEAFAAGESTALATIAAAESVAEGALELALESTVRGRQVTASLPVQIIRNPVTLAKLPVVTLAPARLAA